MPKKAYFENLVLERNYFEDPFAFMGNLTYILIDPQRRELFLDPLFIDLATPLKKSL